MLRFLSNNFNSAKNYFHKALFKESMEDTLFRIEENCKECSKCDIQATKKDVKQANDLAFLLVSFVVLACFFGIGILNLTLGSTVRHFYKRISKYLE